MNLGETENLILQYGNNIQTATSQMNHIHDSDTELAEKITQTLKIHEKTIQTLKANYRSKNGVTIAVDTDTALLNVNKNDKIIRTNHKNTENQKIILPLHENRPKATKQKHSQ